jgi:hypothetical protein
MPPEREKSVFASHPAIAFLAVLALVLGYQLPQSSTCAATQSAVEFVTAANCSVREVAGASDEQGNTWLSFLSQPIDLVLESADLQLQWRDSAGGQLQTTLASGLALGPATVAALPGGGVYVVWEGRQQAEIESQRCLRGRKATLTEAADGSRSIQLGAVEDIPTASNNPLLPNLARLADDSLGLVWQARTAGFYQAMFAQRTADGQWSKPRMVATEATGDVWRPRIAAATDGRLLVAFDHYDPNSLSGFDVWLAIAANPTAAFEQILIAGGPTYQAYPELGVDGDGRAWVVYEEAPSFGQGGPLRSFRRTRLAMVAPSGAVFHAVLPAFMESEQRGDFPRIAVATHGIYLARRVPRSEYVPRNPDMSAFYATWSTSLICFDEDGAGSEVALPNTDGDNENDSVLLAEPHGIALYFDTDARSQSFLKRFAFESALENSWRLARTQIEKTSGFPQVEAGPPPPLPQAWGRPPNPQSALGAQPKALYGDLHRHTDLSRCAGRKDGTLLDAVRYALGPGALSFMAITDHYQHLTPWSFWRQLRDTERWDAPGRMALFPGIERMVSGLGHQNLVFGALSAARAAGRDREPEELRVGAVVAIPHMTSLPANPFAWQRLNPDLQRLIEVHQGRRGSFEGLPKHTPVADQEPNNQGEAIWPLAAFPAQAQVGWLTQLPGTLAPNATPPGVISSSDHASSGTGFAGIPWPAEPTSTICRDSVFQALLERRTFATTGPNRHAARPHVVEIAIQQDESAQRTLVVHADRAKLANVTIFKNGEVFFVESNPDPSAQAGKLMVHTHFGNGFAWELNIQAEGLVLSEPSLRQPRPDLFAPPSIQTAGGLTLKYPAQVSYAADVDLIFSTTPLSVALPALTFELTSSSRKQKTRKVRMDLAGLEPFFARRFWLQKTGQAPYFDVYSLGSELVRGPADKPQHELQLPLLGQPEGAIYYARVCWVDGNFAWSRLLRD